MAVEEAEAEDMAAVEEEVDAVDTAAVVAAGGDIDFCYTVPNESFHLMWRPHIKTAPRVNSTSRWYSPVW